MKRRDVVMGLAALGATRIVGAQAAPRPLRVTFALEFSPEAKERLLRAFASHGLVVGRDLELTFVEVHEAPPDRVEGLVRGIVASKPDAIAMLAGEAIFTFQKLAGNIPFVFYNLGVDPVEMGLVRSMRRPGGNITGTSHRLTDMVPKFWELLRDLRPQLRRGGMLASKEVARQRHFPRLREAMSGAAANLGFTLVEILVPEADPFSSVVDAIRRARLDGLLWAEGGPWIDELIEFTRASGLPTIYPSPRIVRKGGLVSLSPNFAEGERQAVGILARILKGESPATIPVFEATRYHVALNLGTARAMRLEVPQSVLLRADEVIG